MGIAERFAAVSAEVARVAREAGRDPATVTLVGVSKTVGVDGVRQAVEAGAVDFGENRPDHILEKHAAFPQARWHFIGNIQSRRIPDIVACAHLVHSVFQEHHLQRIDAAAQSLGKVQDILIEVNVSGEESKGGARPKDVPALIRAAGQLECVRVRGLMTMAPQGDLQAAKATFEGLRDLRDRLAADASLTAANVSLSELSMGMSEDWRVAVASGATIVRIGRAIFSDDF